MVEHALALLQFAALAGDFVFDFGQFAAGVGFELFLHGVQFLLGIDQAALGAHEFDAADIASVKQALHEFIFGFGQADLLCQCFGVFEQGGLVLHIECVLR